MDKALQVSIFDSAALGATTNGNPIQNPTGARGIHLILDVTAVSGTLPTLDVKLQRRCPKTGKYVDLPGGAFAQKTGTGTDDLIVYPGVAETSNRSVSDCIGGEFRAVMTIGGSDTPTVTFSLAGYLLP